MKSDVWITRWLKQYGKGIHHVMMRGFNRQKIFEESECNLWRIHFFPSMMAFFCKDDAVKYFINKNEEKVSITKNSIETFTIKLNVAHRSDSK